MKFSDYHAMRESVVEIESVAASMEFLPTTKKKLSYRFVEDLSSMPPMSYAVARERTPVTTVTADGRETQNVAEPDDVVMSGPSGERYVVKAAKFGKLYVGNVGGVVYPEQSPRNVARYTGKEEIVFTAPWGEQMPLKPGDYLVKESEGKYYRIARAEYEMTYNPPGMRG